MVKRQLGQDNFTKRSRIDGSGESEQTKKEDLMKREGYGENDKQ